MTNLKKVIYIGGVARSGTSWIGQIFNSIPNVTFRFQPLFAYEFRGAIDEDSSKREYDKFYEDLFQSKSAFLTQKDKVESGVYPEFEKIKEEVLVFKENRFQSFIEPMLRKSQKICFVGVIRNPNATLYSWSKNKKEFPEGSDILKEWRFGNCKNEGNEDYFGYYKWKEVANNYLDLEKKYPERVHLIYYDDFVKNAHKQTEEMFKKMGVDFSDQTKDFIEKSGNSTDLNYYSVFKGGNNKDKWKESFPSYISNEIKNDLKGTRLERFLK